jgi:hypothetical protein
MTPLAFLDSYDLTTSGSKAVDLVVGQVSNLPTR